MIALLTRFSLVGLANTALGFAVIAVLDVGFHMQPALANALAFTPGITVSFFLTRSLVFRSRAGMADRAWKYALATAFAFLLNQLALLGMGRLLGNGAAAHLTAQLTAMASYTVTNFLLCRWVFSEKARERQL
jgi:putative flippase GtrA